PARATAQGQQGQHQAAQPDRTRRRSHHAHLHARGPLLRVGTGSSHHHPSTIRTRVSTKARDALARPHTPPCGLAPWLEPGHSWSLGAPPRKPCTAPAAHPDERKASRYRLAPDGRPRHLEFMGIFDRMGRVISSNVNALLDKAEDPRKSLDLIVEEMKDQIKAARKELVEGVAAEKVLRKKVDDLDADVQKWERRAELALKAGDEKLAREALVQKKRVVAERDRAEALRGEQRSAVLNMKAELDRMEAK